MVILERKEIGTKYPEFRLCCKSLYKKERENKKKARKFSYQFS